MRVIGADIQSTEISWILLDGTANGGTAVLLDPKKHPLPTACEEQVDNLLQLQQTLRAALATIKPDLVAIIRADMTCSSVRAKVECILQIAAKEAQVKCVLIAAQTVGHAKNTKVLKATGKSLESLFFNGQPIDPKYLARAAYCAWSAM